MSPRFNCAASTPAITTFLSRKHAAEIHTCSHDQHTHNAAREFEHSSDSDLATLTESSQSSSRLHSFIPPPKPPLSFCHLRNASLAQGDGRESTELPPKSQRTQQPAAAPGFSTSKQSHERATRLPISPNTDVCMSD
ncbi:uncharacterized [Tachysurus ichikawai]